MSATTIAVLVLSVAAFGTLVVILANAASKRRLTEDIPPALRPGYSDDQLETKVLERSLAWGVVLTLFFAIFLPVYWLREPARIQAKTEEEFAKGFARGEELYQANCALCHGAQATGGAAPSPYGGDPWPAPNLTTIAARYADSRTVTDVRQHIATTVSRGRPGTPMPAWSIAFGGPMTDYQIERITDWILASQQPDETEAQAASELSGEQLYQQNCMRCHGADLQGVVGPTLVGVFARHSEETILGILRNGVNIVGSGMLMPPWQNGYEYPDTRYDDQALQRIVDYLRERQPAEGELPEDATQYQAPGVGEPLGTPEPTEEATDAATEGATEEATEGATEDESGASEEPTDESTEV